MTSVDVWRPYGGTFTGTAALEHLLAHAGVEIPERLPASEALLLGIGGIGFSVNLYPGRWGVHLALGFTRPAGSGAFQRDVCKRLGIAVEIEETGNAALAGRALREHVEAGRPVLLWGSEAALPYPGLRDELAAVTEHLWVVTGFDVNRESFQIADLAPGPLELSADEVAAARSALFSAKHRRMTVQVETGKQDAHRLDRWRLVCGALERTSEALREPLLPGHGLTGMARWADALEDGESPRGWARRLATGAHLFDVLTGLFRAVRLETDGALRGLWAEFLGDAGDGFEVPALAEAGERYRDLAGSWRDLAAAALPDGVPELAEARRLLVDRDRLFRNEGWERGGDSATRLGEVDRRLEEIRAGMEEGSAPSGVRARELLADLARRVRRIHHGETQATEALRVAWEQTGESTGKERDA